MRATLVCYGPQKKEHVNTLRLAFRLTQCQDTDRANIFSRLDSNKKILTSIIRVISEDSWVNIQKDLNKPLQET